MDILENTHSVFYADRLSRDFDHVECVLKIGRQKPGKGTVNIKNETLDRTEINEIGVLGLLDCVSNHLAVPDNNLRESVGNLHALYIKKCNITRSLELGISDGEGGEAQRLVEIENRWIALIRDLGPLDDIVIRQKTCSDSVFYEVLLNEYKNRFKALQGSFEKDKTYKRNWLLNKIKVFEELFGRGSEQHKACEEDLINLDSAELREETNKYLRFLIDNNEKPTRKFCSIGKCKNSVDDIEQIEKPGGGIFETNEGRSEHIKKFLL